MCLINIKIIFFYLRLRKNIFYSIFIPGTYFIRVFAASIYLHCLRFNINCLVDSVVWTCLRVIYETYEVFTILA